jgi:dihydrolipoamide dehydrogenase
MPDFDCIVIGAGPGGYVAAIKAAQHKLKTAIIEKADLGGVCLNWGCIPTKALLKSAEVFLSMKHCEEFGLQADNVRADFNAVVERSRGVASGMAKGIEFLMKKNQVTVIRGAATFSGPGALDVTAPDGSVKTLTATNIIIATGHKPRTFPNLPIDGQRVFHYREAMKPAFGQPKSLLCIGAGAIGMEFGYFYNAMGSEVHIVEVADQVLPIEDHEVAKFVERAFAKSGVNLYTSTKVQKLEVHANGVTVHLEKNGQASTVDVERVLVAVGMAPFTDGLGLDKAGVKLDERGFVAVDENQCTNVPGIYAIGDVAGKQLLAHKASMEAEAAVAFIAGHPAPVDYKQIPGCTYCQPQVASIGLTEKKALAEGRKLKIGRFQFVASGKAKAISHPEGFVKLIFDAEFDQLIGAHLVGVDATEMLAEACLALKLECTAKEIMETVHAHPTLSEAVMEAAADALGQCVHQ